MQNPPARRAPGPPPAQPPAQPRRHLPPSERTAGQGPLDLIDKILDRGLVVDAYVGVRLLGVPLLDIEARVILCSIETYLFYAQSIMELPPIGRGPLAGVRPMGTASGLAYETPGQQSLLSQPAGEDRTPEQLQALQAQAEMRPEAFQQQAELQQREQALLERAQRLDQLHDQLQARMAALEDREGQGNGGQEEGDDAPNGQEAEQEEPEAPPDAGSGQRPQRPRGAAGRFAPRR